MTRTIHLVVPAGIDDPARPSGGNVYDRRLSDELATLGRAVTEHLVPGAWPHPAPQDRAGLAHALAGIADGATVVVDGLIGSASDELVQTARRLRVVVLVHMPLAEAMTDPAVAATERSVLGAAAGVVTTSRWAAGWLTDHHGLPADQLHVVVPGTDPAPVVQGEPNGRRLLCVGPVTPAKGHDTLFAALRELDDLDWTMTCVGALPGSSDTLVAPGLTGRVRFTGPLSGADLAAVRAETDLMVSASRRESFGMAVAESLARATPVVATDVGGHAEAVGRADDGSLPGVLVPTADPAALAAALRRWLTDAEQRDRLRSSAVRRRADLSTWPVAACRFATVLAAAGTGR